MDQPDNSKTESQEQKQLSLHKAVFCAQNQNPFLMRVSVLRDCLLLFSRKGAKAQSCSDLSVVTPGFCNLYLSRAAYFAAILLIFSACTGGSEDRKKPDVSNIQVGVKIRRFDQALFAVDTNQIEAGMAKLSTDYPDLLPIFAGEIIHDRSDPDETPTAAVRSFITAPSVRHLADTVQQVYGDLSGLERELKPMVQYYHYYFPKKPVPQFTTIVSEFASEAFTFADGQFGIGLDLFLGEDYLGYLYYAEVFPAYVRRQFRREYIPVRLAKVLAQDLSDAPAGSRLLDLMIYNGKNIYIADCLLPDTPDSLKMGYTRAQIEGCEANEQQLWAKLLELNLLYSTDFRKFQKLVTPSPDASILFPEAPGESGNWLGWQIVKAYMKRHPDTSLEQLLALQDPQQFLEQAKYKPRKAGKE